MRMTSVRSWLRWMFVGLLITIAIGVVWYARQLPEPISLAHAVLARCDGAKDHAACYEQEVPLLYPKNSMPVIFAVVREIRAQDPSYQFCHVLGHKLGERVVAQDPSKWMDAIPLNPGDGLCSNGFIHGVIGGRFRADVLDSATIEKFLPDFKKACEPRANWSPSSLDQAICYHGMGHLFDFITNADLPKALSLCERVAKSSTDDYRQVCVEGVFMQIYQPLEPDDYALIAQMKSKPTKGTLKQFCGAFKNPLYVGACISEAWPLYREGILLGTGANALCALEPTRAETSRCYTSVAAIIGRMSLDDPSKAVAACERFPTSRQEGCFTDTAEAVLEEDRNNSEKAIALCQRATSSIAQHCLEQLIERASFTFGSNREEYNNFCAALPVSLQHTCEK